MMYDYEIEILDWITGDVIRVEGTKSAYSMRSLLSILYENHLSERREFLSLKIEKSDEQD